MSADLLPRAAHLRGARTPYVLATVVRAQRPTSAKPGDTALVLADGTIEGFVGGTCAESTVRLEGLRVLASGQATLLRIAPDGDAQPVTEPAEGLVSVVNPCLSGGTLEIFLDPVTPPPLLQVFGAAPVARALAQIGAAAGYATVAALDGAAITPDAVAVVVASHGRGEPEALRAAVAAGVDYIGLVASRRRGAAVLAELDLAAPDRDRIHTPAGLDLGARTPAEIAVTILAEIIAVRPRAPESRSTVDGEPAGATSAVDPVCGMAVAVVPGALSLAHAGTTWYFCGTGCQGAFADAPGGYLPVADTP